MTDQSRTPRTDAECEKTDRDYYLDGYVDADFARQLERELAEAQARVLEVEQRCVDVMMNLANREEQRRELKADARLFAYWAKQAAGEFIYDATDHQYLKFEPKPPVKWASIELIRKALVDAIYAIESEKGESHE